MQQHVFLLFSGGEAMLVNYMTAAIKTYDATKCNNCVCPDVGCCVHLIVTPLGTALMEIIGGKFS